jgi:hypothetical protein
LSWKVSFITLSIFVVPFLSALAFLGILGKLTQFSQLKKDHQQAKEFVDRIIRTGICAKMANLVGEAVTLDQFKVAAYNKDEVCARMKKCIDASQAKFFKVYWQPNGFFIDDKGIRFEKWSLCRLTPKRTSSALSPMNDVHNFSVGELGAKWRELSDHLPIGGVLSIPSEDSNKSQDIHFALWNVLDKSKLQHIQNNVQGLAESRITQVDKPVLVHDRRAHMREILIGMSIEEMIKKQSILALEDVGNDLFCRLKKQLTPHTVMVPEDTKENSGDIFIYDKNVFDFVSYDYKPYWTRGGFFIHTLSVRHKLSGNVIDFVQSRVPPIDQAREELTEYLLKNCEANRAMILMGEMGKTPEYVMQNFAEAAKKMKMRNQPFVSLPVPYPTHINCHREATKTDNLFFAGNGVKAFPRVCQANEFSIEYTVNLLERIRETKK